MRYDIWFIAIGLGCLLAGIAVGFCFMTPMGGNLALLPTHAHFNLFGWVTLAIYGLIHKAYPQFARERLAPVRFGLAILGGIGLPLGFGIAHESHANNILVGLGAISGALAAILFAFMFCATAIFGSSDSGS